MPITGTFWMSGFTGNHIKILILHIFQPFIDILQCISTAVVGEAMTADFHFMASGYRELLSRR
jgi:hypothetical protein